MAFGVNIKNWMVPTCRVTSVDVKAANFIKRTDHDVAHRTGGAQDGAK